MLLRKVSNCLHDYSVSHNTRQVSPLLPGCKPQHSRTFLSRSQNCEKRLLSSSCLSVRMKQLGFHWTDLVRYYNRLFS
jgi:hypothetical protein